ncbi:MAG: glycosyltransferase, partial [Paludibacter sp.]
MKVSIIVSVFNEEQVLRMFYLKMTEVLKSLEYDYELIFVNDGSTDTSQNIIDEFSRQNPKIKSIQFS